VSESPSTRRRWDPAAPAHSTARFAENDGVRIHYLDSGSVSSTGEAEPDPVVFVPGMTCVADDYIDVLAAFGRRVLVIDLRGHGRSDTPQTGYHRDDHVRDIEAVVAHAGLDRFHLSMFSRGTAYALAYALDVADRVRSISVGDYVGGELGIPGGVWAPQFVHGRWRGTPVLERVREVALAGVARESVERRYYDQLRQLAKPMLVVRSGVVLAGGHSFVNAEEQAAYRKAGAEIITFDGSPHDLFRNDATRYPSLVADLAARAEAGDG
jgi:pimeloyl-ACP methyl ester carboxylesterase